MSRSLTILSLLSTLVLPMALVAQNRGGIGRGAHMAVVMPPPANDGCSGAIALSTPSLEGITLLGDITWATQSLPPAPCDGLSIAVKDLWYSFMATNAMHRVKVDPNGTLSAQVDVRANNCTNPVMECDISNSPGADAWVDLTGLTVGNTYYVQVLGLGDPGDNGFTIRVQIPDCAGVYDGPAIMNTACDDGNPNTVSDAYTATCQCVGSALSNECSAAVTLPVGYTCNPLNGTTTGATQSIAPVLCNGATSTMARDVWYKFVATGANNRVAVFGTGVFDPIIDVRSGSCNGNNIACADATVAGGAEIVSLSGLTAGATYYVRVYCWAGCQGTFTICVQRPDCQGVYGGPARPGVACDDGNANTTNDIWQQQCQCMGGPPNDNCESAIALANGFDCQPLSGTTVGSSQSLSPITCNTFTSTSAPDVWYFFAATSTMHRVTVDGNGVFDPIVDIRSSCLGTSFACADATVAGEAEVVDLNSLIIGETYYVRIYCWAGCSGTFSICLEAPDCAGVYGGPMTAQTPCDDGNALTMYDEFNEYCQCAGILAKVSVMSKAFLEGSYNTSTGMMEDGLRSQGLVPLPEPYSELGLGSPAVGQIIEDPAVLEATGNNAIVDWVIVELRDPGTPATIVARTNALLQRDGDIVSLDGNTPVQFLGQHPGSYHVAVRHRNHLGCMTAAPVSLGILAAIVDFRSSATPTWGTDARKSVTGAFPAQVLWAGDVTFSGQIKYTGSANDRDPILTTVGSTTPNNTVTNTYSTRDVNMNGQVKYTGSGNDRDPILINVGSTTPNNVRTEQLP